MSLGTSAKLMCPKCGGELLLECSKSSHKQQPTTRCRNCKYYAPYKKRFKDDIDCGINRTSRNNK